MFKGIANLKRKYPVLFGLSVGIFLAAGAALAAFIVYTGVNGSSNGNFAGSTTNSAITVTGGTASGSLSPSSSITITGSTLQNDNPGASETLLTLTPTVTTKNASSVDDTSTCASHLTVSGQSSLIDGHVIAAGAGWTPAGNSITVAADASTPASCASGTFAINWTGTTNP